MKLRAAAILDVTVPLRMGMPPGVTPRRFPPAWSVEVLDACYVVRDHGGQKLAYVYFEDEPGRR